MSRSNFDTYSDTLAVSIYSLRSRKIQRRILLIAASISVLTPVTDTIVLPALISMNALPGSSGDSSAAVVSAYMGTIGACNLFWGPLSDRFGRRGPLVTTLVMYIAVTIALIFAPSASALVGLRAAQGAVTGATISITQVISQRQAAVLLQLYGRSLLPYRELLQTSSLLLSVARPWGCTFYPCLWAQSLLP